MNTGEKQQSLQCANGLHYLKPHWKIIRDGFPLSVFDILSLFPLTTMVLLSAHDSLDSLDIVSLFIAIDATFIEIVHNAAGLSFQGPVSMAVGALSVQSPTMAVGARDWVRVRDMFQRAVISSVLLFVCISLPAVLASFWVFQLCGQSEYIAGTACACLACGIFYEPACIIYTLINKILIANHKVWPVVVSGVVVAVTAIGMECFAYWIGAGPVGMVFAYMLANFATLLFIVFVSFALPSIRDLKLFHWSREAFSDLGEMIALFLKSLLYQFSMRVPRMLGAIVIGLLGETPLAAQAILLRFVLISFTVDFGFWTKAVAVMGRAAGANKHDKFYATFIATLTIFAVLAFFTFILLFALRYPLAYVSTSLESVQTIIIKVMPLVAAYAAIVLMWMGSHSIAFSVGRINAPTFAAAFSSFCIGIPISMLLMFRTSLELYGFYIGLIASDLVALAILWTYYACNWNDLIRSECDDADAGTESSPLVSKSSSPLPLQRRRTHSHGADSDSPHATAASSSSEADSRMGAMSDLNLLHVSSSAGQHQSSDLSGAIKNQAETAFTNDGTRPIED